MFPIETVRELPRVRAAVAAPDGDRVAFYADETGRDELYVLDAATGECEQRSDGTVHAETRTHLAWSADGEEVLYHYCREDARENDIYAMDGDGEASPVVVADGACLLTDVRDSQLLFLRESGAGRELYRHDRDTHETTRVVEEGTVMGGTFDPDGERIAYTTAEVVEDADVFVVGDDGAERLSVGADRRGVGVRDWRAGELLVESWGVGQQSIGVLELAAGGGLEHERWLGSDEHREHPLEFRDDGRVLGERWTHDAALVPAIYGGGSATLVGPADGVADFAGEGYGAALADGGLLLDYGSPIRRQGLYRYDPATGERDPVYEPDRRELSPEGLVDADHVLIEPAGGPPVSGLLYEPRKGDDPAPAVVSVSKRPRMTSARSFDWPTQLLASRGYAVLRVNQRGANRYLGPAATELDGELGRGDQRDIARAAGWLADRAGIDGDRIGVLGRRYGGFSAYLQALGRPEQYACAVAWGGIADPTALYRDADAADAVREGLARWIDGEPGAPAWRERSPIERAGDLEVPLGIVHAVDDAAVPIEQSRSMRRALREAGFREGAAFQYRELEAGSEQAVEGYGVVLDILDRRL